MLLLRRLRTLRHHHHHHHHHHSHRHHVRVPKLPFSSLSSPQSQSPTSDSIPKPGSLSARMSFVFDQIDAIEKERSEKDQTLQRIRAWRESKRQPSTTETTPAVSAVPVASPEAGAELVDSVNSLQLSKDENEGSLGLLNSKREVELVHPWPEWIELMERLVQQNYFDHRRKDEDGMMENLGFNLSEMVKEDGFDFTRDFKTVQTAVLNFGRDRFDILRSLSRQDLQVLVGYGCPSTDKKVVFSAKLLRKLVHLDEGDVCSSCSLRSSCERAYLLTNKEDEARTIDVMRVLLTYGFDAVNDSVMNKPLLKMKSLKTVVRRLLYEVVKLSAVPIDPNLPPPVIKKPPPKVKQPPPPPKKRVGRDDIEMKKGDWLCPKCDFMNFAKNTKCLQCDAKRPKRQLLPGEWECPQCNFLNYRRNMVCFHCEHKRPPDEFMESQVQERQRGPRRLEKAPDRREFSNAWNFDFDDNESDGADVAAFEYADSRKMDEDFPLNKGRGHEDGYHKGSRQAGLHDKENSDGGPMKPGIGFNDFDDEDDDLDSYELDTPSGGQKPPRVNFSELEVDSISEDEETTHCRESNCHAQTKRSKSSDRKVPLSGSDNDIDFGSDDDLPVHPNWKSSHVTQFEQRSQRRGAMSFGSEDELSSEPDDTRDYFGSQLKKGNKWSSSSSRRGGNSDLEDESFSYIESNNKTRFGGKRGLGNRGGQRSFKGGGNFDFEDSDLESNSKTRFGRGGFNKGGERRSSRRRGNSNTEDEPFSDLEFDNNTHFGKGGLRNNGGQRSKRDPSKEIFGRPSHGFRGKRSDDDFNFRSSRREGSYKQRSDNQRGDGYWDNDRFSRPRVNVR